MSPAKYDRQQVTNFLTLLIVGVWIIFSIIRIWVDIPQAAVLDTAMPLVIGYWFTSSAITKKNGNDEYVGEHRLES